VPPREPEWLEPWATVRLLDESGRSTSTRLADPCRNFRVHRVLAGVGAVLLAFQGKGLGVGICLGLALFESWRARSVFRDLPQGPPYDEKREREHGVRRIRISATVLTIVAVAESARWAVTRQLLLLLAGLGFAGGAVLTWFWLLPRLAKPPTG
jgi:hypothetical protein